MKCTKPNHIYRLSRWVSFLAALAVLFFSISALADDQRVLVDIGPIDNALSREAQTRLSAELKAAGFELTTTENFDIRVTLIARDGRLVVYVEYPHGATAVVRADDIEESGAPEVLAVRAVERIRADLAVANAPPPTLVKTPPPIQQTSVLPKKPHPLVNLLPAVPRHVLLGGQVSLDGGAFSVMPTIALGTNLGERFFIRGSFWGPTTKTTVQSASAQATVWSLGGRLDAGLAFPVRRGTNLGVSAGLGLARYAIEGKPSPGFTPRATGQAVFLGGLDAFWLQALTQRFYMELDLGIAVALPSVVIRINQRDAGERGFPEVHARFGFAYAF